MVVFTKTKIQNWKRSDLKKTSVILTILFVILALPGCYKIKTVNQSSTAEAGSQITTTFDVDLEFSSYATTSRHGIVGIMVPNDWVVDSVSYSGFYNGNCTFLPADSADADTGGQVDYWTDTLEVHYPTDDNMQWVVFQSDSSHMAGDSTGSATITIKMTVGETEGDFGLGYFVSDSREDFTGDTTYYDASLNNAITVTAVTGVEDDDQVISNDFSISQNYPNPFNPTTSINFNLPTSSNVVINLYNILGSKIMTIADARYQAGSHQVTLDASKLASGTYIYSINAIGNDGSKFTASKKMVLLK